MGCNELLYFLIGPYNLIQKGFIYIKLIGCSGSALKNVFINAVGSYHE